MRSVLPSFLSGLISCFVAGICITPLTASAIPDIESDGRLGSWIEFLQSMGLSYSNSVDAVYLDTDNLTAGTINYNYDGSLPMWSTLSHPRTELRQNIGRVISQPNGPNIVVYDFTEIITKLPPNFNHPYVRSLVILGQRPAAIVCQGSIGGYDSASADFEEASIYVDLTISALNSCDPDNPLENRWAGTSPGSNGIVSTAQTTSGTVFWSGNGGGGGYGGSGQAGGSDRQYGVTALGGNGGAESFSWNVLQPGSPGGGGTSLASGYSPGGQGGGAVLIKAKGSVAINKIYASGASPGNNRGGYGSGGHIVIDCPGSVRVAWIYIEGGRDTTAGGGVVEFRKATRILGGGYLGSLGTLMTEPAVDAGSANSDSEPQRGVVGLPQGVAFPPSGSADLAAIYRTANQPDSSAPIISINGNRVRVVAEGSAWADEGASATDGVEGVMPVTTGGFVNTAVPGSYEITYTAADSKGNTARKKRYVTVMPNQPTARDPQSGLPELVAAALRPVNSLSRAVDTRLLPSFEFTTVNGQKYPTMTFLRRARDFMPIGNYTDSDLDKTARMNARGFSYSFRTASTLSSWSTSASLDSYTFVRRDSSRNGVTAPLGMEFATYRHNTPLGSSPPLFYRVAIKADPLN